MESAIRDVSRLSLRESSATFAERKATLMARERLRADVICTLDRRLYQDQVQIYCRQRMIEIMDDLQLLAQLRNRAE